MRGQTAKTGYAGVYYTNGKSVSGRSLANADFSFTYRCQPWNVETVTCVSGGAPRWSIPISDGSFDPLADYAFVDAPGCGSTRTVSTTDALCQVNFPGVGYANWDAFAAGNPTYTIANAYPFVIAEVQTWSPITLYDVTAGRS